jgi:hypothetical protein
VHTRLGSFFPQILYVSFKIGSALPIPKDK